MRRALPFALLWAAFGCNRVPDVTEEITGEAQIFPPTGKALVVFVRPSIWPFRVAPVVMEGSGRFLCNLHGGSYFAAALDPGPHDFIITQESSDLVRADLAADRVYVIEVFGFPGVMDARFVFSTNYQGDPNWPYPHKNLTSLTATAVKKPAEAQAALVADLVKERTHDGHASFRELKGHDLRTHTLNPEDGFDHL